MFSLLLLGWGLLFFHWILSRFVVDFGWPSMVFPPFLPIRDTLMIHSLLEKLQKEDPAVLSGHPKLINPIPNSM